LKIHQGRYCKKKMQNKEESGKDPAESPESPEERGKHKQPPGLSPAAALSHPSTPQKEASRKVENCYSLSITVCRLF
jgi:hypothetical protein